MHKWCQWKRWEKERQRCPRDKGHQVKREGFQPHIGRKLLSVRTVSQSNRLPREFVQPPSMGACNSRAEGALNSMV